MTTPTHAIESGARRAALARILPFGLYVAFLALGGTLAATVAMDARWMYALQISAVVSALLYFRRDYVELTHPADPAPGPLAGMKGWIIALLLGAVVWALWIWLDFPPFAFAPGKGYTPLDDSGRLIIAMVAVRILGAAVVVPVMEELFWRAFIMRWLDNPGFLAVAARSVTLRSLLFSSIAFGFEHGQWAAGIVAGLVYGWLYRASGRLWLPIVSHGLTNLLLGLWVVNTGQWQFW
ncbi:MAG: CAAX prenyl protease-related protein [Methyloversatilis sp.]|jgi:CAAX prenyl protease-like protein|nr:CAAX prenyl protease-related protein [Methyloversatilis sp.]MBP6194043.1 CAAX prenyl protease-related protein [Methyloversatilis sp.]MBP9116961.1 CAAX prenyl protease-related protein [Methyloversatilis sp.]